MPNDRAFDIDAPSAPYGDDTTEEKLVPRGTTSRMDIGFEEYRQLRRAEPACKPLPRTLRWVASLPPNVQPTALLRHYARIANVMAATWEHSTSLRSYMDCLFSDNRGNRQGFPQDVLRELVALKRYHESLKADSSAD
jgi:hypothetical protein